MVSHFANLLLVDGELGYRVMLSLEFNFAR